MQTVRQYAVATLQHIHERPALASLSRHRAIARRLKIGMSSLEVLVDLPPQRAQRVHERPVAHVFPPQGRRRLPLAVGRQARLGAHPARVPARICDRDYQPKELPLDK